MRQDRRGLGRIVGRFRSQGRERRRLVAATALARRDLADLAAGAEALPGKWRIETDDADTSSAMRAWLRPMGDPAAPAFGFARGDGFILVHMSRGDTHGESGAPASGAPASGRQASGTLVFGAFASVVAAFDAIHNDIVENCGLA
ncbi:MAG: hypothetical protein WDN25_04215 [Acetobacteraceae bacterium]